ncbi:MAG: acetyl-CoA C-acyltransferase [Euryarchaeota archaeon]|jgi:acetyl-CoA acyltransferase|nr:acetyl-CoA C-acyltransferase [Euryarchaeota archaeon]|tara:strand:- start:927 stop:2060 length:1134 start_codon:yes stop_codon:yes gene_type:complete
MVAVIVGYARSPFTRAGKGALYKSRPDDIAATVVNRLLADLSLDPTLIEDLIVGTAFPEGEQGFNLARMITFLTDLPETVPGVTINRFCGSSMQAIHDAAGRIAMGAGDAFIAGGVESMTRIPMTGFNPMPNPRLSEENPATFTSMGITAENLARKHGINRETQEAFAVESHARASKARESGAFADEIVPIETEDGTIDTDGCIRPDTDAQTLSGLRPAFDADGTVTAGTSSPLTDGAAFVLVCSEEFAAEQGLTPLARIVSTAVSGCAPEIMGIGPVEATKKALNRAGLSLDDIDIVELNEAFAAQSLAVIGELGLDAAKTNIEGGAIALGHPLGASGARITGKAAQLLHRNDAKRALATMCVGGGQGIATILEKI